MIQGTFCCDPASCSEPGCRFRVPGRPMSIFLPRFNQPLWRFSGAAADQGRGGVFSVGRRLSSWTRACS